MPLASTRCMAVKQCLPNHLHLCISIVLSLPEITPHRPGPAGVGHTATDDVQMQLRDEISQCGEIDFCAVEMLFNKACDHGALLHDLIACRGRQVQQVGDVCFGYQYEPRYQRVPVQQYVTLLQLPQRMGIGKQMLMDYELRQGK
jgi:hypothetical protein